MITGLLIALIKTDQELFFLLIIQFNNLLLKKNPQFIIGSVVILISQLLYSC